jgi:hypothetical protein
VKYVSAIMILIYFPSEVINDPMWGYDISGVILSLSWCRRARAAPCPTDTVD